MWRAVMSIVWTASLTSVVCAQASWHELNTFLTKREAMLARWRTEWQLSGVGQSQMVVIQPFEKGYLFSATFPSETRQFVLLREQPYAYFCRMLGGVIVQHLTWVHGTKLLPYLAGVNLLRYMDEQSGVQVTKKGKFFYIVWTLRRDFFAPIVPGLAVHEGMEVVVDPERENAVVEVRTFFGTASQIVETLRVTEWQYRNNIYLPRTVEIHVKGSVPLTLRLKSAEVSSVQPPDWLRPPLWVNDWRLGITRDKAVVYEFKNRLPDLGELDSLRQQQRTKQEGAPVAGNHLSRSWGSFASPVLLIAIGALWYWRLRRRGEA